MNNTYTLRQTAETIGNLEGRDGKAVDGLHQQIRGWQQRGHLSTAGIEGEGYNAAALFDDIGLCHAGFLSRLHDLGFDGRMLRVVSGAAQASNLAPETAGEVHYAGKLAAAVRGSLKGEQWSFVLTLKRNFTTGEKRLQGHFVELAEDAESVARILDSQDKVLGWRTLASVNIPVTELFRGLLEAN